MNAYESASLLPAPSALGGHRFSCSARRAGIQPPALFCCRRFSCLARLARTRFASLLRRRFSCIARLARNRLASLLRRRFLGSARRAGTRSVSLLCLRGGAVKQIQRRALAEPLELRPAERVIETQRLGGAIRVFHAAL